MHEFLRQRHVQQLVLAALESSIYEAPDDSGLSLDEVVEVCKKAGTHEGECRDAINDLLNARQVTQEFGDSRLRLAAAGPGPLGVADFFFEVHPDPRDPNAFQFVYDHFTELERKLGRGRACASPDEIVAQARAAGHERKPVRVAVEALLLTGILVESGGEVRRGARYASPREQLAQRRPGNSRKREELAAVLPLVRDILARRTDGRAAAAEPLDAFSGIVEKLGHQRFVTWWAHLREELLTAGVNQPTTAVVMCAALAEGAFALVAARARPAGLMSLPEKAKDWSFDTMLRAARSGNPPILRDDDGQRWKVLNQARHRIHAGRLLDDVSINVDWKPEEVRASRETLDLLLRRIIEWPLLPGLDVPNAP